MDKKKLNCYASQCCYWDEACGCAKNNGADNDRELCDEGEEITKYKIFVIVDRGMVTGVFSDNPGIAVEIIDCDSDCQDEEDEGDGNALDEMRERAENIEAKYHTLY